MPARLLSELRLLLVKTGEGPDTRPGDRPVRVPTSRPRALGPRYAWPCP